MQSVYEHDEQSAYFDWVRWNECRDERFQQIYAIPNGQLRSTAIGVRLKREGVRAGVLDINIDVPSGKYHGARIEMKAGRNRPTKKQAEQIERNEKFGYVSTVCWSAAEAILFTMAYFGAGMNEIRKKAVELGYQGEIDELHD